MVELHTPVVESFWCARGTNNNLVYKSQQPYGWYRQLTTGNAGDPSFWCREARSGGDDDFDLANKALRVQYKTVRTTGTVTACEENEKEQSTST